MTSPTALALLEMEGTIDDLWGIADVIYKMAISGDAGEGKGLVWLSRASETTVKRLEAQWNAVRETVGASDPPGPVLVNDEGAAP